MATFFGREARIRRLMGRIKRDIRRNDEVSEAHERLQPFFQQRFGATPTPGGSDMCAVEPDDRLRASDFQPCETCGCSLLARDAFPVEIVVHNAERLAVGHRLPRHEDVLPSDYKFYCKRDKLPYERVVITPAVDLGHATTGAGRDYYVANRVPQYSDDNACGFLGYRVEGWRQVTVDGEQFD